MILIVLMMYQFNFCALVGQIKNSLRDVFLVWRFWKETEPVTPSQRMESWLLSALHNVFALSLYEVTGRNWRTISMAAFNKYKIFSIKLGILHYNEEIIISQRPFAIGIDRIHCRYEWIWMNCKVLTLRKKLTFRGPCIVIYSYNESQRDALFLRFIW
jgi:hypothetical protein